MLSDFISITLFLFIFVSNEKSTLIFTPIFTIYIKYYY